MFPDLKTTRNLPDEEGARRFFYQLTETHPAAAQKLRKKTSLLADVLAIAAFSPLLAMTLLQNPAYISWLERRRESNSIRSKEGLLESLARFSLTNSQIELQILLSRFRRRELLGIYLRDIRRLGTIAETTDEISNLADAVLEYALGLARQELDNRYGIPLETNEKERENPARFCIVSLGKLGSHELNYSSDIDLLFLYSGEGLTSGKGTRGEAVTNREYFIKLAELITKIVGEQTGEGAAYRVDLRLRPHGRVGALAISLNEAVAYYQIQAQAWERQMLIRARSSAGDSKIFKEFWKQLEPSIYSTNENVENALRNVKLSKDKINLEHTSSSGFNVKLGTGGIREIEFIAQALQLAYGGRDKWLRSPHTLISLSRLADRKLLSDLELTELSEAYEFLRRLEHRLQMENGLQTHHVPNNKEKRLLAARRMDFVNLQNFNATLLLHTRNVNRIFERVFGAAVSSSPQTENKPEKDFKEEARNLILTQILTSIDKSDTPQKLKKENLHALAKFSAISPHFAEMISANPRLAANLPLETAEFEQKNYEEILSSAVSAASGFRHSLADLRTEWMKCFLEIAALGVFGKMDLPTAKRLQTELAEASINAALLITESEIQRHYKVELRTTNDEFSFAVLGLGKLGGRTMDYGSDLDLVLIYDDEKPLPVNLSHAEFYSRAVDIFINALSSFTREGNLYRVDLRLRPDGKNGASSIGKNAFFNYLETRSAIWEWLAYIKLRGAAGAMNLASEVENTARKIIHENVVKADKYALKTETRRIRELLALRKNKGKTTDIKFAAGGLLDIYFAARFLQLRDNIPDDAENRSTRFMLKKLFENKSLSKENFFAFAAGHDFLNLLDHNLRLTVGRSNSLPLANKTLLQIIAGRMNFQKPDDLLQTLALHRIEIRASFDDVLKD
ncbi:MAG: hypothetical protein ACR2LT_08610 [Pyrinomonadaceae bacterium]